MRKWEEQIYKEIASADNISHPLTASGKCVFVPSTYTRLQKPRGRRNKNNGAFYFSFWEKMVRDIKERRCPRVEEEKDVLSSDT